MLRLKTFKCTNFKGYWPVGTAAIIVARNERHAFELLEAKLFTIGLEMGEVILKEIDTNKAEVHILIDGNY